MRTIQIVTWTDRTTGQKQERVFYQKSKALIFLNYLILDRGFYDAKRRTERLASSTETGHILRQE